MSYISTNKKVKLEGKAVDPAETKTAGAMDRPVENNSSKSADENVTDRTEQRQFDEYAVAFHYGWETAAKAENAGRTFEELEPELERGWNDYRGASKNAWQDVKDVIRYAYNRIRGIG